MDKSIMSQILSLQSYFCFDCNNEISIFPPKSVYGTRPCITGAITWFTESADKLRWCIYISHLKGKTHLFLSRFFINWVFMHTQVHHSTMEKWKGGIKRVFSSQVLLTKYTWIIDYQQVSPPTKQKFWEFAGLEHSSLLRQTHWAMILDTTARLQTLGSILNFKMRLETIRKKLKWLV